MWTRVATAQEQLCRAQGGGCGAKSADRTSAPWEQAARTLRTPVLLDHRLSRCKLSDSVCRDLSEALREAPALAELGLFHNGLSEAGLRVLSEGLASPQCRVQTLR